MEDFEKILWGFTFSAVGIAFGWLLNQMGQWLKSRHEDKRQLKLVLFNLFEIYDLLIRSDYKKFVQILTEKVFEKIPGEKTEADKRMLRKIYLEMIENHFHKDVLEELKIAEKSYLDSIKILAAIYPITAFYLNSKKNIFVVFEKLENWFENLNTEFPDHEIDDSSKIALEIVEPDLIKRVTYILEEDIKNISWKINPYVWHKSNEAIENLKTGIQERLNDELDNLLSKIENAKYSNHR